MLGKETEPMDMTPRLYTSSGGARIYQIPVLAFPGLWGWVYLVLVEVTSGRSLRVLIDSGSGFGESNHHLEQGIQAVCRLTGVR